MTLQVVWDCDRLESLEGLGAVTQLFSRLWIDTNSALTNLTGLDVRLGDRFQLVRTSTCGVFSCPNAAAGSTWHQAELNQLQSNRRGYETSRTTPSSGATGSCGPWPDWVRCRWGQRGAAGGL